MLVIPPDDALPQPTDQLASTQLTASSSTPVGGVAKQAEDKPKVPARVYPFYNWADIAPSTSLFYLTDLYAAENALARFKPGLVGFDQEWKPIWRKGQSENRVALIQLANNDTILLLQVSAMGCIPPSLIRILGDPDYVKTGVGIQGDCKKLWNDWGVNIRNCVDLALLARTVDNARWKGKYTQPIGLARLCETYTELTLNKGKITRSNWEARLSGPQQLYAANDAHSGLTLLKHLLPMVETTVPRPLPVYYSFDVHQGWVYETSTALVPEIPWVAENPNYDPGPPPEPKPPKEKKEKKDGDKGQQDRPQDANAAATVAGGTAAAPAAKSPRNARNAEASSRGGGSRGTNRGRGHYQPRPPNNHVHRDNSYASYLDHRPPTATAPVTVSLGYLAIAPQPLNEGAAQNRRSDEDPSRGRGRGRGRGRPFRGRGRGLGYFS